ncbi:MAG TPA: amino acid adenylation domain-containing protein [Blastocatellia bacterium]|nr:amino acid adenylation domain-containing protein [Blastocatellia bacterium]
MTKNIDDLSPKQRELLELLLKERQQKQARAQIKPAPRGGESQSFPLSFAQQRLWYLDKIQPGNPSYNLPFSRRIEGPLDVAALERSFDEINRRHEGLRTHFLLAEEGDPVQVVSPPRPFSLAVEDLSGLAADSEEAEIQTILNEEARRPFDLAGGPLLRARLLRLSGQEHVLMLTMHHIISDGWSMGVLFRELGLLYEAFVSGKPSPLPELPIQYADFAVWQREWLKGDVLKEQLDYWKAQLEGMPSALELPTDRPRPPVQSFDGAQERFTLSKQLSDGLKTLSKAEGSTLFMTLLAGFQVLLSRYTGQEDIVVGSPIAGRNRSELEGLIGFFVNTLVLRTRVSGDPSFVELLRSVKEVTLGAFAHGELPFEKLVEELDVKRDRSRHALFQVLFVLQNAPQSDWDMPGLSLKPLPIDSVASKFDLTLDMHESAEGLRGSIEYNRDLFDPDTIRRLIGHFERLLAGVVANPNQRVSLLPLLSESELQSLAEWNDTRVSYQGERYIHELFEEQVRLNPDAIAVTYEGESLTYKELNRRANQLAHYLRGKGVGPEVRVSICMDRSLDLIVGLLGILKAGGAYVPLDTAYPKDRLNFMLADSGSALLLTHERQLANLPEEKPSTVLIDAEQDLISRASEENPERVVMADNPAYVIYTSGSTGQPKGAMNTHRGISNRLLWMQDAYGLTGSDNVLQKTPFSFDVSVWEFFWPLLNGARLTIARPGGHQDGAYLVDVISKENITTIHFVPSMLHAFLEQDNLQACASLKRVICSGEALSLDLQRRFQSRLTAELHNLYGPTEAAVDVTHWACKSESDGRDVPIGKPIANTQIYILDSNLQPTPIGVAGQIHIGGDNLGREYVGRPDLTAEKFMPHPLSRAGGERLYRTGDLGRYRPDGNIEFIGRMDNQIKLRGYRIELGEIEAMLNMHAQVRECAVTAETDKPGNGRLVAYLVASGEVSPKVEEFRAFLRQKLPDYMVPSAFVVLDAMPLTPGGKIDRRALTRMAGARPDLEAAFVAPRNSMEKSIALIWEQVLGLEQVGVHDNFFDLGGHSLLLGQVFSKLQKIVDRNISMVELLEHPTISSLAKLLNKDKDVQPTIKRSEAGIEKLKEGKSRLQQQLRQRQLGRRKPGK